MGIWNIHRWNVLPEKMNEHEDVIQELKQLWHQLRPNTHVHYFRQRFGPMNGRVLVFSSFESLAEWESFQQQGFTIPQARKLLIQWVSCWDQSSHDEFFWDEAYVELMTKLTSSS